MLDLNGEQRQLIDGFLRKITGTSTVLFWDGEVVTGKKNNENSYQEIHWIKLVDSFRVEIGIDVPFEISQIKQSYLNDLLFSGIQEEEPGSILEELRKFRDKHMARLSQYSLKELPLSAIKPLSHLSRYDCRDMFDIISLMIKNTENGFPGYLQHNKNISEEIYQKKVIAELKKLDLLP